MKRQLGAHEAPTRGRGSATLARQHRGSARCESQVEQMKRIDIPYDKLILPVCRAWEQQWLLLTAGDFSAGAFNPMTVAWGAFGVMWSRPLAMVVVRPTRYTYRFMEQYETFTLCAFHEEHRDKLEYCGNHSGRNGDKAKACGLTPSLRGDQGAGVRRGGPHRGVPEGLLRRSRACPFPCIDHCAELPEEGLPQDLLRRDRGCLGHRGLHAEGLIGSARAGRGRLSPQRRSASPGTRSSR